MEAWMEGDWNGNRSIKASISNRSRRGWIGSSRCWISGMFVINRRGGKRVFRVFIDLGQQRSYRHRLS